MEGVVTGSADRQVERTESARKRKIADDMHTGTCPVGLGDLGLRYADLDTQPLQGSNHGSCLLASVVDVACSECDQCHSTVKRQPQRLACCLTIVKLLFVK